MEKQLIYDFTKDELTKLVKPAFRAKQIYNWLYTQYVSSFDDMKNIPKDLKTNLKESYDIDTITIAQKEKSSDGSIKYLFRLKDGHTIESVLLKMKDKKKDESGKIIEEEKYTVCISSQVGCKVGCSFCLTAKGGFVRNLTAGEIVYQILAIKRDMQFKPEKRVNIVYMGMGEPLDNYDNVVQAIKIFAELDGLAISPKRQTISTSGISSKIERLGELDLGVNMAISLHAVDDELRSELIPMNKAHNINSLIDAIKKFPIDNRKRVMFEYLVIKDKNDDLASAKKLLSLLNGIKAKVNLIYFNPYEGSPYSRPTNKSMKEFQEFLVKRGLLCTIRESKGLDISAACGQLREKEINNGCC
jgi:23S rRNA (adenine2503-C2)-methyltransferase